MKQVFSTARLLLGLSLTLLLMLSMVACSIQSTQEQSTQDETESNESVVEEVPAQTYSDVDEDAHAWALTVFDDALQKLVDQNYLNYEAGTYDFQYNSNPETIHFLHQDAVEQYLLDPIVLEGKVVFVSWKQSSHEFVVEGKNPEYPDTLDSTRPTYCPVETGGYIIYPDIEIDRFANSIDECDYLILYGGFESSRDVGYYTGGVDRVGTTTQVFIVDAKTHELVHVEWIDTDLPGFSTESTHTTGTINVADMKKYLVSLLAS